MKKILCLILIHIFLTGCSKDVSDKNREPQEEITYTYEDVDATITYIDMRKWFAICPRWQWEISVEYDGLTYENDGYASGATTIRVFLDGKVIAYSLNDLGSNDFITMAKYSTKEKAMKAMEMCREKYLSRMELDGGYDTVNGCYVHPNYWVLPKVFQFPADDEI